MNWTRVLRGYGLMGAVRAPVWLAPRRFDRSPRKRSGLKSSLSTVPRFSNAHTPLTPIQRDLERLPATYARRCTTSA